MTDTRPDDQDRCPFACCLPATAAIGWQNARQIWDYSREGSYKGKSESARAPERNQAATTSGDSS